MLQLILGLNPDARDARLYQEIQERLEDNLPSWILVPEQFSLSMEKEILSRFGLSAQRQVRVLTFSRLCNLIFRRKGPLRMQYIDGAGKQILAARTLDLSDGKLIVFQRNLHQKGFAKILVGTFSECKRYGVSPQILRFVAEHTEDDALRQKLCDIAELYQTYDSLLTERHADAEDNLALICPRLQDCEFLNGNLYLMHFRSLTPVEYRALGELMHRMNLIAALDYTDAPQYAGLFSPVEHAIRQLRNLAAEAEVEEAEPIYLPPMAEDTPLAYLQDRYFDPKAESLNNTSGVMFHEATNIYRETEAAADWILKLCRTRNLRFSDFLILARDIEPYRKMMPAIFERRGVRVFLDTRRKISTHPLMRLTDAFLDILAYGYSYERIMTLARCDLFAISREDADELENYILATAPTPAMWHAETWEYTPGHSAFDLERINRTRDILTGGIRAVESAISGTKTGVEISAAILRWMKDSGLAEVVSRKADAARTANRAETADEYAQVWNTVIAVLNQIATLMADTKLTYRQFRELFASAVANIEIGMTPQTLDSVPFAQIDRFRNTNAKIVLVLGMNDGVFPQGYMTEGLLTDAERQTLQTLGIELAPGRQGKQKEEQLLIHAVLSAPQEELHFFRPVTDRDGKRLVPSGILKRVQELLGAVPTVTPHDEPYLHGVEGSSGAFDLLASALAEYGGNADALPQPLKELYHWFLHQPKYRTELQHLLDAMNAEPPKMLSHEMVKALYGEPLALSASQLESYNGCAFRYFMTYGLLLRERELAGLEPKSKGSIQHGALYRYFTDLKNADADFSAIDKEECFRAVAEAVEQETKKNAELLYESSAYYQYIVMQMKGIAARTAWEVVKFYRSGQFRPYGLELTIGTHGDIPALSVKNSSGDEVATIRGIIDRADTAAIGDKTAVSITDYKSSAKSLDIRLTEDGITLQPLLYAHALCSNMENAVPVGMMYLQMTDPIVTEDKAKSDPELAIHKEILPQGWLADDEAVLAAYGPAGDRSTATYRPSGSASLVEPEDLQRRIQAANGKILASAEAIAGGNIGAEPYRTKLHDACAHCQYCGICQTEG